MAGKPWEQFAAPSAPSTGRPWERFTASAQEADDRAKSEALGVTYSPADEATPEVLAAREANRQNFDERVAQGATPEEANIAIYGSNDRFLDTTSEAMEAPLAGLSASWQGMGNALSGGDMSQSPGYNMLPEWLKSRPNALVVDAGLTGLNALGTVYAGAAGLIGEAFGGDRTGERQLARDLMLAGEVAAPELAGVSGTVRAVGPTARAAERAAQPATSAQEAARAADRLGITPSLGMNGRVAAGAAAGLEKVPLSGGIIGNDMARAVGEIQGAFGRITAPIGEAMSSFSAGDTLQKGLRAFTDRVKARSEDLYNQVDQFIPSNTRTDMPNARAMLADAKAVFDGNPELAQRLGLNNWDAIMAEAGENGISWQALRQLRTAVGEAIGSPTGTLTDESTGRLKRLYGALTEDMDAAVKASGGTRGVNAWERANNYYRASARRIEEQLDGTITARNPERAFEAFDNMLKEGRSSSDIRRVRAIKQSLGEDAWRDISASIVQRLGEVPAGQRGATGEGFSASTFLTRWNQMDPEARRILMPAEVRQELEDLARVAQRAKEAGAERNFSNTGTPLGIIATLFGGAADLGVTATALGAANLSSRALTSSMFLRAMNSAARGDSSALRALARTDGPFRQDAMVILGMTGASAAAQGE